MKYIVLHNLRESLPKLPYQIRVDRASMLGNPYRINSNASRDQVCDAYQAYFYQQLYINKGFYNEVMRLYNVYITYSQLELFCWCVPNKCHASTIKFYLESLAIQNGFNLS